MSLTELFPVLPTFSASASTSVDEKGALLHLTHSFLTKTLSCSVSLLLNLGFVTLSTFFLVFSPFVYPPSLLLQSLHRIFPFARGLFEDKVANVWCALNIVVKLRDLASVATLAKLALAATGLAVLPGVVGMLWGELGGREAQEGGGGEGGQREGGDGEGVDADAHLAPTCAVRLVDGVLPLLVPGAREEHLAASDAFDDLDGWTRGRVWADGLGVGDFAQQRRRLQVGQVVATLIDRKTDAFSPSMWPLLKRDGLGLQYIVLTLFWNYAIGYNPLSLRPSFVKFLSLVRPLPPAPQPPLTLLCPALLLRHPPPPHSRSRRLSSSTPPRPLRRLQPHPLRRRLRPRFPLGDQTQRPRRLGRHRSLPLDPSLSCTQIDPGAAEEDGARRGSVERWQVGREEGGECGGE